MVEIVKGMNYPTVQAMPAATANLSAMAITNNSSMKLANLNKAVGGRKNKRNKKNKKGGTIPPGKMVAPQFDLSYKPIGAGGQDPNSIIKDNAGISTQGYENAINDKYANIMRGGNSKWNWGCSSGGKRTNKRKTNKRKTNKRKTNKRKTNKRKNI